MKVVVIGGGPGGLYFAIQMKKADPSHQVIVHEQNAQGSTYGWGVVFSDSTLDNFEAADSETYWNITNSLYHWDDIEVCYRGECLLSSGHGFSGLSRQGLLDILSKRAEDLGADIRYNSHIENIQELRDADVVVASDGVFSKTRERFAAHFKPDVVWRKCKYIWLGTTKPFPAFTFDFKETEFGWFQAHCYQFSDKLSTVIIECPEEVWRNAGIDKLGKEEGIAFCAELFADLLEGHQLLHNSAHLRGSAAWLTFPQINCQHWFYQNIILLGDASATAHFSVGSGTKLAMESAIALADALNAAGSIQENLTKYQETRRLEVLRLQNAARNSTEWFENIHLKSKLKPKQFAYSLLTRSQRVSHENLRLRDKNYLEETERWFVTEAGYPSPLKAMPPMFAPFRLREMELSNRIVVSPMDMYCAVDGVPADFHLVHLGSRALGGAGLIYTEMACVSPDARITPGCAGMYNDEHITAWKRIVDFVHKNSNAKMVLQLGHAGRKGSTKVAWEGMDEPLDSGNWPIYAPSPLPYTPNNQVPREMTRDDMNRVRDNFVQATIRAEQAGFDMLELHCAHGYLLSSFISPLCNVRTDEFGGSLENRMRFPRAVFTAMRAAWPKQKPMSVRISATDWVDGGITIDDAVEIGRMFAKVGVDIIDVSAGQVSPEQRPVYGRMFQTPFADRIRAEVGLPTMAVGNIYEADHINSILASGRADLCMLARPHLADPHWTLHAAAECGYEEQPWPKQYLSGKDQLYTLIKRAKTAQG